MGQSAPSPSVKTIQARDKWQMNHRSLNFILLTSSGNAGSQTNSNQMRHNTMVNQRTEKFPNAALYQL